MEEKAKGNTYFLKGMLVQAEEWFTAGIERLAREGDRAPEEDKQAVHLLHANRSKVRLDQGKVELAFEDGVKAIELNPTFGKAYARRGMALFEMDRLNEAVVDLEYACKLDPTLNDGLTEIIAKAKGETGWQPSDALKKQRELQRSKGACYVFRHQVPEREILQPVDETCSMPAQREQIKRTFKEVYRSGDRHNAYLLYDALCYTTFEVDGRRFKVTANAVRDQLQKELGFDPSQRPEQKKLDHDYIKHRPTLYTSFSIEKEGRKLYPGHPGWLDSPDKFFEVLSRERPGTYSRSTFNDILENVRGQRNSDHRMQCLETAYNGRKHDLLTVQEHVDLHRQAGLAAMTNAPRDKKVSYSGILKHEISWETGDAGIAPTVKPPPTTCDYCGERIEDEDPAECICGMPYCSDECHKMDWNQGHAQTCQLIEKAQHGGLNITTEYWQLVAKGALPLRGRPDFEELWRQKSKGKYDRDAELEFYLEHERKYLAEKVGSLQDTWKQAEAAKPRDQMAVDEAFIALLSEFYLQRLRMSTPLKSDSLARLGFKHTMCQVYINMAQAMPFLREGGKSKQEIDRMYLPLIEKASKNAPDRDTWRGGRGSGGSGSGSGGRNYAKSGTGAALAEDIE